MAAKITTIWILYVHVVLNDVIFKQLLDEVFWISRIIKFEVRVFSRITETLIILDTTKTESSNCFIIRWTKEKWKSCFCFFSDGKQHKARKLDMNTRDLSVLDTQGDLECPWHSRWPWVSLTPKVTLSVLSGRLGGLMVSALNSGASGPGSSPDQGHCVVFLGKTLNSHNASLHPGV